MARQNTNDLAANGFPASSNDIDFEESADPLPSFDWDQEDHDYFSQIEEASLPDFTLDFDLIAEVEPALPEETDYEETNLPDWASKRIEEQRKKRILTICAGIAAVALVGGGVAFALSSQSKAPEQQPIAVAPANTNGNLLVAANLDAWDSEKATPAIIHISGKDVDFFHALSSNDTSTLSLPSGIYTVSFISPINPDGSIYEVSEQQTVKILSDEEIRLEVTWNLVAADAVSNEQRITIIEKIREALQLGDDSLKGEAGNEILSRAESIVSKLDAENKQPDESDDVDDSSSASDQRNSSSNNRSENGFSENAGSNPSPEFTPPSEPEPEPDPEPEPEPEPAPEPEPEPDPEPSPESDS